MKNNFQPLPLTAFFLSIIFCAALSSAQTVPPSQQASGLEGLRQQQERERKLREKIEKPREVPANEEIPQEISPETPESEKILIEKINVSGAKLLSEKQIRAIVSPYENRELTLREMQKVADLVTDAYRQKGNITSRAYLPVQRISNRILEINVVEGKMGDLTVEGNRYFKKSLYEKKIKFKKGEPFDYNKLRESLSNINQSPDRSARTILTPGKEPGQTDVVLKVQDRLPIHAGFSYDNFASRYIGHNRYQTTVTDNNLLGFDDILMLQYQTAEGDQYRLSSLRYLFPVTDETQIGFYAGHSYLELGEEFKTLLARGKSKIYSLYATHKLITEENLAVALNAGFDYKDVINFQLGNESSRDRLRIINTGVNVDRSDSWGRTIFNEKLDFGIPNILGGLDEKDSRSSRAGGGSQFVKSTLDLLRLQRMMWSSTLLLKSQLQFASHVLTAAEQYQLGGITNVRGYPPGEFVGDDGRSVTAEWGFPLYFVPKNIKVPFSQAKIYDAVRVVAFYDWGEVSLRNPGAGERKSKTLRSIGTGLRVNLPENFYFRYDIAWPLEQNPSDDKNPHSWFQVTKEF